MASLFSIECDSQATAIEIVDGDEAAENNPRKGAVASASVEIEDEDEFPESNSRDQDVANVCEAKHSATSDSIVGLEEVTAKVDLPQKHDAQVGLALDEVCHRDVHLAQKRVVSLSIQK